MTKKILLLLLITAIFSCKNSEENVTQTTWISGQIINPTTDFVIFSRGSEILDTVKLDSNNFFLFKSDSLKPGLYSFTHNESQVFYIEPGDSLLIHINTFDFDESLAYSGKGGEQNNLLMDLYLTNEAENLNLPKWYVLTSEEFGQKIDSIREVKMGNYRAFVENHEVDDGFKEVAVASITYDYYSKKELYAAANMSQPHKFKEGYFDYRNEIDFNLNKLKFYYPYYRFLIRYFDNLALEEMSARTPMDRNSFEYNYKKIKLIDSLIPSDSLKNNLLRFNTKRYLLNAKDADEEKKFFEAYKKMNSDEKYLEEVETLYNATVKLTAGNAIPNILLVNTDNVVKNLQSIITSPTVLYFWSVHSASQYQNIHNRAAELKSKYPEYDFIGINTDTHFRKWRQTVKKTGYDAEKEFQLENISDAGEKLVLSSMSKAIILDKNAVILEGKTNMFNPNFEELLLGFLNR